MGIKERIAILSEIEYIIDGLASTVAYFEEMGYNDPETLFQAETKKAVIKELEKLAKGI